MPDIIHDSDSSFHRLRPLFSILACIAPAAWGSVAPPTPIVHWNQDPSKSCEVVWLERGSSNGKEGSWTTGPAGFGYGDDDDSTVFSKMKDHFSSLAIRKTIPLAPEIPQDASLILRMDYDDGFIAWLDGKEVARSKVLGSGKGLRAGQHHEAGTWEEFPLGKMADHPKLSGGVLALRGFNFGIGSSDFTLHPELIARSGNREWQLIKQGQTWEYLAQTEPTPGWQTQTLAGTTNAGSPSKSAWSFRYRLNGETTWKNRTVEREPFAGSRHYVLRATLKDLPYDREVEFQILHDGTPPSAAQRFRMPATTGGIRFVTGGDLYHKRAAMDEMNRVAGKTDPLFALIGGDLAYANDSSFQRWFDYLDSWSLNARTPDGRMIPKIVAIGNHEIKGHGFHPTSAPGPEAATMFYSIFHFPEGKNATHVVDIGSSLSLVQLDSGHTKNIADQDLWLENTLKSRRNVQNLFVAYHRPAWGSGAKEDSKDIRKHWCPIFEKHRISAVFEYDHHVFCRSHPLLGGKIDATNGIPYLGSGAWSVDVRRVDPRTIKKRPWIAATAAINHLYLIETQASGYTATAIDIKGKPFDHFSRVWKR